MPEGPERPGHLNGRGVPAGHGSIQCDALVVGGGICPGCARQWKTTQCPACEKTSPHRAWYHLPSKEAQTQREEAALGADA